MQDLATHLRTLARNSGDRALKLTMPPNWTDYEQGDGVYQLSFLDDDIAVLCHRFTDKSIELDRDDYPWASSDKLHIDLNFSDARASLRCEGVVNTKHCANLLLEKGVDTKPVLALPAGGPRTPSKRSIATTSASSGGKSSSKKPRAATSDLASEAPPSENPDLSELPSEHPAAEASGSSDPTADHSLLEATFQPPVPEELSTS